MTIKIFSIFPVVNVRTSMIFLSLLRMIVISALLSTMGLVACSDKPSALDEKNNIQENEEIPAIAYLKHNEIYNPESVIPAQCYTKTEGDKNPCYVCHQSYKNTTRPNFAKDASLQGNYEFSEEGMSNSWKNLFKDRRNYIQAMSDETIMAWIKQDNYSQLIDSLKKDKSWKGEVPEIHNLSTPDQAFDKNGLAKDGSYWVAYNYKPLPSSFWPTNGSTGDAMIRLPKSFREVNGQYSEKVYLSNLAIVEKNIKQKLEKTQNFYLGDAQTIEVAHMLYPQGTEFLHTVRYLGIKDNGEIYNSERMKEVRYMKKANFKSAARLKSAYSIEAKEKYLGQLPQTILIGDRGIDNGFGWVINGYIEDENGRLRQQNKQELAFCNGCHKTLGSTIDQVFSFSRKVDGEDGWGYIDLKKIKDVPNLNPQSKNQTKGEYLTYFERVKGGDEFRQNKEMLNRWFNSTGVNEEKVLALDSIYPLITPSKERALALNKAYKAIVDEQSYIFGRDAILAPADNVLQQVDDSIAPLSEDFHYQWDIRLDWSAL